MTDSTETTPDPRDVLLTERELGKRWGLLPSSLATQRSQGRGIPYVKLGTGTVRYRLSDVLDAERTVHPGASA